VSIARFVQEFEPRFGDGASDLRAAGLSDDQVEGLRERLVAA
jgi:hypothetical protein